MERNIVLIKLTGLLAVKIFLRGLLFLLGDLPWMERKIFRWSQALDRHFYLLKESAMRRNLICGPRF